MLTVSLLASLIYCDSIIVTSPFQNQQISTSSVDIQYYVLRSDLFYIDQVLVKITKNNQEVPNINLTPGDYSIHFTGLSNRNTNHTVTQTVNFSKSIEYFLSSSKLTKKTLGFISILLI
jgi:hypothetical protein